MTSLVVARAYYRMLGFNEDAATIFHDEEGISTTTILRKYTKGP